MEAETIGDFRARDDEELSFPAGATVKLLNYVDKDFCMAEYRGRRGLVPANHLSHDNKSPYFKGIFSRKEAEVELSDKSNGEYLVRVSESSPDTFSLSVKCRKGIQHYKIYINNGKYRLWSDHFDTVDALLHHHHSVSVSQNETILLQDIRVQDAQATLKVKAMFDFNPTSGDELKFRKGDILEVINQEDPNWWDARHTKTGQEGVIPSNYVTEHS